jgi:very-short-patch-repair endonuclease
LVDAQHGVVARRQLLALGFSRHAIDHRVSTGRLHLVGRGIYAVGRPGLTRHGRWMAAVLSGGPGTVLSHGSAAALWRIGAERWNEIEVSVRAASPRQRPGVRVYRRPSLRDGDLLFHREIPATTPVRTMVDLALRLGRGPMERVVNEADKLGLVNPEELRVALDSYAGVPGARRLREMLDRRTFRFTATELENWFLPLAEAAGLPVPLTRQWVNGFEVDFYWPQLGFVVETDGLRYHRTPAEQARDRLRDQAHTAAGLSNLRFTHEQVRYEPGHVRATLVASAVHLRPVLRSGPAGRSGSRSDAGSRKGPET